MFKKTLNANWVALGIVAAALLAEGRAAACTMPAGVSAREFNRAQVADIRTAPRVAEG